MTKNSCVSLTESTRDKTQTFWPDEPIQVSIISDALALATQWTQDQAQHSLEKLTPREEQVLKMVGDGYSSTQIGLKLGIAGQTVNTHVKNIFRKLKVRTRAQAIFTAYECGLH
ncbi:hypothetical protein B9Z38_15570 [Limnohabitans sp. MMS-10A-160]|jgi:DNA-binding CsgD family transcriptional regulator|uniref:response regulator transcription factor n=1 Tax=unclassified Limnohabitans TaxID=2626134 RepID=UPI000D341CC8|nr:MULTISPECIES: response regulator transcription factor [unclassified Limnohabitans]PUE18538.1 hypothetical protein B9Z43_12135 [Limnohabitans sp. MMS-10A-192]PUE22767.1 hypothetical protein B9Z38_15570 [Limnohabitans sp. MMS-10A-160]